MEKRAEDLLLSVEFKIAATAKHVNNKTEFYVRVDGMLDTLELSLIYLASSHMDISASMKKISEMRKNLYTWYIHRFEF